MLQLLFRTRQSKDTFALRSSTIRNKVLTQTHQNTRTRV